MIETTVGRVIFNDVLPDGMPFYNIPMRSSELAKVISDCYAILGRRADDRSAGQHEQGSASAKARAAACRSPPTT